MQNWQAPPNTWVGGWHVQAADDEPEDSEGGAAAETGSYDYLLSMSINSLTMEKVQGLQSEAEETRDHVERLRATTEKQMWLDDLDAFLLVRAGPPRGSCCNTMLQAELQSAVRPSCCIPLFADWQPSMGGCRRVRDGRRVRDRPGT